MVVKLEGMTEWQLDEIRSRMKAAVAVGPQMTEQQVAAVLEVIRDRAELLHELDRLRSRIGSYQLCPKCRGQKHVQTPPWWPGDRVFEWVGPGTFPELHTCSLCAGSGMVERPPVKDV